VEETIFLTPSLQIAEANTFLRGQSHKQGTWPHLIASGKRPVEIRSIQNLVEYMSDSSAKTTLAFVLTFIGVVQWPTLMHLEFADNVLQVLNHFHLPPEYKVSVREPQLSN